MYEPGLSFAEAKLRATKGGVNSFPRELAYPCERHENWYQVYDYIGFPSESSRLPFDSVGQSRIISSIGEKHQETSKLAQVKQVFTQSSHINSAKLSHDSAVTINSLTNPKRTFDNKRRVFNLPFVGVQPPESAIQNSAHFVSAESFEKQNKQDIHVYPHLPNQINNPAHEEFFSPSGSSVTNNQDEIGREFDENLKIIDSGADVVESGGKLKGGKLCATVQFQTSLEPDPILRLRQIIGFGSRSIGCNRQSSSSNCSANYTNIFKWSRDSQYIIYGCQAICVAYHVNTNVQYCFVGHSDRVSCLTISPDSSVIASGQAGPYSLVRLWDFQTRKVISRKGDNYLTKHFL